MRPAYLGYARQLSRIDLAQRTGAVLVRPRSAGSAACWPDGDGLFPVAGPPRAIRERRRRRSFRSCHGRWPSRRLRPIIYAAFCTSQTAGVGLVSWRGPRRPRNLATGGHGKRGMRPAGRQGLPDRGADRSPGSRHPRPSAAHRGTARNRLRTTLRPQQPDPATLAAAVGLRATGRVLTAARRGRHPGHTRGLRRTAH